MKTCLIDMDGILADFNTYTIEQYNKTYGTSYNPAYGDYLLGDSNPREGIERNKVVDLFLQENYFLNMLPIPGAIQGTRLLQKFFNVEVVTKVWPNSKMTYWEKDQWLARYLPELVGNVHFVTGSKKCVYGDILIDDAQKNQEEWKGRWKNGIVASLKYPWTDSKYVDIIAATWDDLAKLVVLHAGEIE